MKELTKKRILPWDMKKHKKDKERFVNSAREKALQRTLKDAGLADDSDPDYLLSTSKVVDGDMNPTQKKEIAVNEQLDPTQQDGALLDETEIDEQLDPTQKDGALSGEDTEKEESTDTEKETEDEAEDTEKEDSTDTEEEPKPEDGAEDTEKEESTDTEEESKPEDEAEDTEKEDSTDNEEEPDDKLEVETDELDSIQKKEIIAPFFQGQKSAPVFQELYDFYDYSNSEQFLFELR